MLPLLREILLLGGGIFLSTVGVVIIMWIIFAVRKKQVLFSKTLSGLGAGVVYITLGTYLISTGIVGIEFYLERPPPPAEVEDDGYGDF